MKTKQILPIDLYLEYKKGRKEREAEIIELLERCDKVNCYNLQEVIKQIKEQNGSAGN